MAQVILETTSENLPRQPAPITNWAAIAGRWKFEGDTARYEGSDDPHSPLGIAIGSTRFRDGIISTQLKLERNEQTTGGIVFGFQSLDAPYFIAALGGFDDAYSISEYRPGSGWVRQAGAGSLKNIVADDTHALVLDVRGQAVRLTVNDVDVLDVVLNRPIEGTGIGLYAWDRSKIEFRATKVIAVAPTVFVIMPFKEPFDTLYREVIVPVATGLGFKVIRADEIPGPGIILDDIQQQIEEAHVVVAEITKPNPNVFYELGYAHALKKPAVLLRQTDAAVPFDIHGYRAIPYSDTIGGKKMVERHLQQHLNAVRKGMPESVA